MQPHPVPRGTPVFPKARGRGTGVRRRAVVVALIGLVLLASCSSADDDTEQRFPDVIEAQATATVDGWRFDVTVSSPYDTPDRYADAWRIVAPDGTVLGVRELLHDHQFEQPFTRSLTGVTIPDDVSSVTIEARDSENGWGGGTAQVEVAER